jgi:hypothetical protein
MSERPIHLLTGLREQMMTYFHKGGTVIAFRPLLIDETLFEKGLTNPLAYLLTQTDSHKCLHENLELIIG